MEEGASLRSIGSRNGAKSHRVTVVVQEVPREILRTDCALHADIFRTAHVLDLGPNRREWEASAGEYQDDARCHIVRVCFTVSLSTFPSDWYTDTLSRLSVT